MITAKQAIKAAVDYVREFFATSAADAPRLEELEQFDDGTWKVTVSFLRDGSLNSDPPPGLAVLGIDAHRDFKAVTVSPLGDVKSVAVRTFTLTT